MIGNRLNGATTTPPPRAPLYKQNTYASSHSTVAFIFAPAVTRPHQSIKLQFELLHTKSCALHIAKLHTLSFEPSRPGTATAIYTLMLVHKIVRYFYVFADATDGHVGGRHDLITGWWRRRQYRTTASWRPFACLGTIRTQICTRLT